MQYFSTSQVLDDLRRRVKASSQKEVADSLGFGRAFINDVLHGRRELTDNLALAMGYVKQPDRYARKGK